MRRPDPIRMVWDSDKQYLKALEKYCDELEELYEQKGKMAENQEVVIQYLLSSKLDGKILTDENALNHTGCGWVTINCYNQKIKQCEKLERELEGHEILVEKADEMYLKIKELEKALDKSCEYLARYGNGDTFVKMNKGQWKEWSMEDE